MKLAILLIAAMVSLTPELAARSGSHGHYSTYSRRSSSRTEYCRSCARDMRGRIARSSAAKSQFRRQHPCPATGKTYGPCAGYVIDHVTPLKRGGEDAPANMQWQTREEARAKDRVE